MSATGEPSPIDCNQLVNDLVVNSRMAFEYCVLSMSTPMPVAPQPVAKIATQITSVSPRNDLPPSGSCRWAVWAGTTRRASQVKGNRGLVLSMERCSSSAPKIVWDFGVPGLLSSECKSLGDHLRSPRGQASRFATGILTRITTKLVCCKSLCNTGLWWAMRDLNPRHPACKAGALTN